jgi:HD-GYP domain-containing protein (c-di-GMP phosphodiesterase class II)
MIKKAKTGFQKSKASSFERLIKVGIALSAERDTTQLLEKILLEAKGLANADGGTLYLSDKEGSLKFEIMSTDSLNIFMGGASGEKITFQPIPLLDLKTGEENHTNVASSAALTGKSINIPDAYNSKNYDFTGTKKFDEGTGYRSKSFLTVPMKNSHNKVIGVLQLLNAKDLKTGKIIPFSNNIQPLVEALASQAAMALDNRQLLDAQKALLDSFIELIGSAIDSKSPYTGGHCQRVPELTKLLAVAACNELEGPFADFNLTDDEWYELHIAAWLHDCGKVTTPEYVVDKATKLETIYDRIHEIRTRFEVLKREAEINYLKAVIDGKINSDILKKDLSLKIAKLDDDFAFIAESNIGGEFMSPEQIERVKKISKITWTRTLDNRIGISHEEKQRWSRSLKSDLPVKEKLLDDRDDHIVHRNSEEISNRNPPYGFKLDVPELKFNLGEVYNLCIPRGTLTKEERFKINDHIVQTIIMLEQLPFPDHLKRVPEYAGGHHEKMDGTGYPRKLKKDDMSTPARIMAIADIFEALTAADRPYKLPKKLSDSIKIMSFMKKDSHIDSDLFRLFLTSGVYKTYAEKYLSSEQLDEVDIRQYLDDD